MYLKKTLFIFVLLWLSVTCWSQQSNHLQLLNEKKKSCESIMASFSGKSESIAQLIKEGKEGLQITTLKDHEYRLLFNNAVATGFYYKQDFKAAKQYFEQGYEEATKAGLIEKSLKPLGNLIAIYHYLGMQNKADSAAQKLKQIVDTNDTLKYKTDAYYNLGIYNQQQKFYYSIALSHFLKSVELHKPIVDTTTILKRKLDYGTKVMMVAEIYLHLKQPNKALEYLNEVKPYLNLSLVVDVAAYGKFIRSYVLLGDKKQALKYYDLLHNVVGAKPSNWSELVSSNLEIASLAMREKDFRLAKFYIDKADKQAKIDHSELLTSGVNLSYGDYFKGTNNYLAASKYYKMAEKSSSIYNKEQYSDLLKSLAAVEIKLGNQENAAHYFNKYVTVSDSLNQRKISLNLAEMEAKFQNEAKQQRIGVLNKDNQAKSVQLKQEKTTRFLLIGGAVLLLIALFSIYLNFRTKQKANLLLDKKNRELDSVNEKLIRANETKAKLFSIIAHDLRSPVSQLFTFLKLQTSSSPMSEEEKSKHQKRLLESSATLLSTMEDLLLWSKSQMEQFELDIEQVTIEELFKDTIGLMLNQAEAKKLTLEIKDIMVSELESDQNLLTIILRNLLQNAINHSYPNTKISLNVILGPGGNPVISILNHGMAIPKEKIEELLNGSNVKSKSSGYGLLIVKELLQKLNAILQIESNADSTKISVVFAK